MVFCYWENGLESQWIGNPYTGYAQPILGRYINDEKVSEVWCPLDTLEKK